MTTEGVQAILNEAEEIGENVYNFFPRFKKFESIFEKDGVTIDRDIIKAQYPPHVLETYDEVMYLKKNKDIVVTITSALQMYESETYDYVNAKIKNDTLILVDKRSGDTHYIATDQINTIIRYEKNAKADIINPKTGEREYTEINKGKPREPLFYKN